MRFTLEGNSEWTGNFEREWHGGVDDVLRFPGSEPLVLVIAGGLAYLIDVQARRLVRTFSPVEAVAADQERDVIYVSDGIRVEAVGENGILWTTERISWDGIRNLRMQEGRLEGDACDPTSDGNWTPFSIDPATGEVRGGSYSGPPMTFDDGISG